MSKVSVFDKGWIDLVFEGRNQSYGAYQLRQQDGRTTLTALFLGIALVLSLVSVPVLLSRINPAPTPVDNLPGETITPVDLIEPPVFEKPKPEPLQQEPAAPAAPAAQAPTVAYTNMTAAAVTTVELPTTAQTLTANAGQVTNPGDGTLLNIDPAPAGNGPGITGGTGTGSNIESTASVDVMPMYPGGIPEFLKEVGRRYRVPETTSTATLKVYVSFVIETDGTLSNIKALRDPGYGMGQEAIRVLKSMKTKWTPGKIKGQAVRTAYNLPITINVK